jgi:hypothetical protein
MPEDPTKTIPLSWLHYNPNYIPVLNTNTKGLTRTISCQVTLANEPRKDDSERSSNPDDKAVDMKQTLERDSLDRLALADTPRQALADKPRLARSLSARRPREKVLVKNDDLQDFRRSLSVRRQDEKERKPTLEEIQRVDEKEKKVMKEERKSSIEDVNVAKKDTKKTKDKGKLLNLTT